MDRYGCLDGDPGYVLAQTGRDHLAEDGSSEDEHRQSGDRPGGVADDAGEPDTDDGDQAGGHGTEDEGLRGTGMAQRDLDVLAGEDALAELEADDIAHQGQREDKGGRSGGLGRQHQRGGRAWP